FYFVPSADVKIFLLVDPLVGAKRIMKAGRLEETAKTEKEAVKITKAREKSDIKRYKKLYGIKNYADPKHYDLMINTTKLTVEQVQDLVVCYIEKVRKLV
ncbi:MAG: cytidylate kinase family protein, partial [Candidatus Woesearchaeota archaeon]